MLRLLESGGCNGFPSVIDVHHIIGSIYYILYYCILGNWM